MSSDPTVRRYVEDADAVLMLGTFITDMNMGLYTAKLQPQRTVLATTESIKIAYHHYDNVDFRHFLQGLVQAGQTRRRPGATGRHSPVRHLGRKKFSAPLNRAAPLPLKKSELTDPLDMRQVMRILSLHLDSHCCVIADVGDGLFGAMGIRTGRRAEFIAPAYYLSMGFAVPAAIGIACAAPHLRPVVLVGDGAFQMTGTEVSTAVALGLNPIILILNNDGYGTMRKIRDGPFNLITRWDYGKICALVGGGETSVATTKGQLDGAIQSALGSPDV